MRFTLATLAAAATSAAMAVSQPGSQSKTIQVKVSPDQFTPNNIEANIGDLIEFHFDEGLNSVVQTSYGNPCVPIEGGFSSGTFIVGLYQNEDPHVFTVPIQNKDPIWFYNSAVNQCYKYGTVGGINIYPNRPDTISKLSSKARLYKGLLKSPNKVQGALGSPNMRLTTALLAFATGALAMPSGTTGNKPNKVVARAGATHTVTVSDNGFSPGDFEADAGDILEFHFKPGSHSVTQASFINPCRYLQGGFASGVLITSPGEVENSQVFQVYLQDNRPVWFFKGGEKSCSSNGLVGVVNAPGTGGQYYGNFQRAALRKATTELMLMSTGGTLVTING
ncbi:hypothetical protein Cpir12675_001596 [Ceratocystis pirilliformis]|uniref:Extracellular serine-rich protein n=1 Tax=Ceratocystis pirilliformis TaxID=259994 RepID=A0ABR3ZG50_9PEZI